MTKNDVSELVGLLAKASRAAGESLLDFYMAADHQQAKPGSPVAGDLQAVVKDAQDPRTVVSKADLAVEQLIISILGPELDCRFLSEEAGSLTAKRDSRYRVVLDPLDGSRNYLDRTWGLFGVSIGIERYDELWAGAICLPYYHELIVAEKHRGALFLRYNLTGESDFVPLRVDQQGSRQTELSKARVVVARGAAEPSVLSRPPLSMLIGSCGEAVNFASCSIGLASVALGRTDALVLPTQRYWDFAAGYRILQESGCAFEVWQDSWHNRVDEQTLSKAGASDYYNIAVAGSRSLLDEIVRVLNPVAG